MLQELLFLLEGKTEVPLRSLAEDSHQMQWTPGSPLSLTVVWDWSDCVQLSRHDFVFLLGA